MNKPNNTNDPHHDTTADEEQFGGHPNDAAFQQDQDDSPETLKMDPSASDQPADQIEKLKETVEEANRRALMAHAEMENSRKRMRRDYEDQLKYAALPLLQDFLPVLDNLQRAIAAAGEKEAAAGLVQGVAMVAKQFQETLAKHHCKPIPSEGELFDPNFHEAISQMPSDQHAAGVVAHQAVAGYQLHDRVVRPSQVIVSTGPADSQ
jgi:molecular chaperone GrpE